jgi:hypothetical protein
MRTLGLALMLLVSSAAVASAQSVGGKYRVTGTNPNGSAYTGTAEIIPSGDSCRMSWNVGGAWKGICMLSNKSLAATYRNGNTYGLVIYELQPNGVLKGVWTVADSTGVGTEILAPAE